MPALALFIHSVTGDGLFSMHIYMSHGITFPSRTMAAPIFLSGTILAVSSGDDPNAHTWPLPL